VSRAYILKSTLSDELLAIPDILHVNDEKDSIYQGIVTIIVALIYLNGGVLAEGSCIRFIIDLRVTEQIPTLSIYRRKHSNNDN